MTDKNRFPFKLKDAFFVDFKCMREAELSGPSNIRLLFEVRVVDKDFPSFEVFLLFRTESEGHQQISISGTVIGLFGFTSDEPPPDRSIVQEFLNERALYILWQYVKLMIRQMTAHMGMPPLNIEMPTVFELVPKEPEGVTSATDS